MVIGILSILLVAALGLCIYLIPKVKHREQLNKEIEEENEKLEEKAILILNKIEELKSAEERLQINADRLKLKCDSLDEIIKNKTEFADETANNYYEKTVALAKEKAKTAIDEWEESIQEAINEAQEEYFSMMKEFCQEYQDLVHFKREEINNINKELDSIKLYRDSLIQARLREKEMDENTDFYCIHLDPLEEADIDVLEKIKNKLNNPRILSMLIWQTYIRTQVNTLCANILGNDKVICGIYKITNIDTKECYIGQAVDVATRWKNHCKAGLGIDTPQGNKLYIAMKEYKLPKFSFELLEECEPDQLNEREAYYIDLYNSYNYGYNSNRGIKGDNKNV